MDNKTRTRRGERHGGGSDHGLVISSPSYPATGDTGFTHTGLTHSGRLSWHELWHITTGEL